VRNNRRTGHCLAAGGGVALVAAFLWGWFSAALVAPAPTPLLLDRQGGFLAQLPAVRSMFNPAEARLSGRQYYFPDEIATGGELLSLVRTAA